MNKSLNLCLLKVKRDSDLKIVLTIIASFPKNAFSNFGTALTTSSKNKIKSYFRVVMWPWLKTLS